MRLRTISTFALGPIGAAALGFVAVPLVARLFSPEDIGRFNIVQTILPLVVTGVFLGLDQAYVREFHESPDQKRLQSSVLTTAILLFALVGLPFAFRPVWTSEMLFGLSSPWLTWYTLLSILLALLLRQWMLVARMKELSLSFSIAQLSPKLILVGGLLTVLFARADANFAILLQINVFASFVGVVILVLVVWRHIPVKATFRGVPVMLRYSLPLALASFLYIALNSVSTFMVRHFVGFVELGVFAISISIAAVAGIVQQIFSIVWSPIVYRALAGGDVHATVSRACNLVVALFGLGIAAVGSLSSVVDWFLPVEYSQAKFLVVGLAFVPLVYMVREVTAVGILITRRTGYSLVVNGFATASIIGLNLWFTPLWGAAGAVASAVIVFWAIFVVSTEISARIWFGIPRVRMHVIVGSAALCCLITLVSGWTGGYWHVPIWIFFGVVVLVSYRATVMRFVKEPARVLDPSARATTAKQNPSGRERREADE